MPADLNHRVHQFDTVPLPSQASSNREDINQTVRDHPAWPGRAFDVNLEWNNAAELWYWWIEETTTDKTLIERAPALYKQRYTYREQLLFIFADPAGSADRVTPGTLGDRVELIAIPGLQNPAFEDWLARQEAANEEDRR